MQKRDKHNKATSLSEMIKKSYLKFPLVVILFFTFFIQSTPGLGYIKGNIQGIGSFVKQIDLTSSPVKNVFTQVPNTSKYGSINMDAEVEYSEEDELSENVHVTYSSPQMNTEQEWAYDSFLKIRYLQLSYAIQQQAHPALFVLHHSWKNSIA